MRRRGDARTVTRVRYRLPATAAYVVRPFCIGARRRWFLPVLVGVVLFSSIACAGAEAPRSDPGPLRAEILDGLTAAVRALARGEVDPVFGGLESGPATPTFTRARSDVAHLAAKLARAQDAPDLASLSQRIWSYVLQTAPVRPEGAIGSDAGGRPDAVETMFVGVNLAMSTLTLRDQLPPEVVAGWTKTVVGAATFLENNGNVTFYTNGNINVGNTLFFRLTAELTGDPRWRDIYEQALAFTLNPPGSRWDGYGLTITREPTRPDGADGVGFLAEKGEGGVGFDPDYVAVQAEQVARLYLVDRDRRVLRLLNLLTNALLPRIDLDDGTLDTGGGTRHPKPDRKIGYLGGTLAVLDLVGCRGDLDDAAVRLGRAAMIHVRDDVAGNVEGNYGRLAFGPSTMTAAVSMPSSACAGDG